MSAALPSVTVLMAVYNGAADLPAQLKSLKAQAGVNWHLIASDDRSTDDSAAVLAHFAETAPVQIVQGPGQGFARNFLSLLSQPGLSGPVALCDQDDVWFPDKLERALAQLDAVPAGRPALYCSRRINWWPEGNRRRLSRAYPRQPAFANALVENIAPGNTIVLNAAALDLARETVTAAAGVPFHDWWLYLLISGAGGVVLHDPAPTLLYRQHAGNVLGQGEGFFAGIRVRHSVAKGVYADRIGKNLLALEQLAGRLTQENRERLALFAEARQAGGLLSRLTLMRRAGVYRQGWGAALGFWGAAGLGRV